MADLEASSPLARRLSTAEYFAFIRRLVRVADDCIIDSGGIPGRHAGDGVVAFFLAERRAPNPLPRDRASSPRGRCATARRHRGAQRDHSVRALDSVRTALGWDAVRRANPDRGRSEVTALGDEVNETARIEACATSGRTLASKSLIERLDRADAEAMGRHSRITGTHSSRTSTPNRQGATRRTGHRNLRHRQPRPLNTHRSLPVGHTYLQIGVCSGSRVGRSPTPATCRVSRSGGSEPSPRTLCLEGDQGSRRRTVGGVSVADLYVRRESRVRGVVDAGYADALEAPVAAGAAPVRERVRRGSTRRLVDVPYFRALVRVVGHCVRWRRGRSSRSRSAGSPGHAS